MAKVEYKVLPIFGWFEFYTLEKESRINEVKKYEQNNIFKSELEEAIKRLENSENKKKIDNLNEITQLGIMDGITIYDASKIYETRNKFEDIMKKNYEKNITKYKID